MIYCNDRLYFICFSLPFPLLKKKIKIKIKKILLFFSAPLSRGERLDALATADVEIEEVHVEGAADAF